jgi:hypothetical protein
MPVTIWYSVYTGPYIPTQPYPTGFTWTKLNSQLIIPQCNSDILFGWVDLVVGQSLYLQIRDVSGTIIYQNASGFKDQASSQNPCLSSLLAVGYTNAFGYGASGIINLKLRLINPSTTVAAPSQQ